MRSITVDLHIINPIILNYLCYELIKLINQWKANQNQMDGMGLMRGSPLGFNQSLMGTLITNRYEDDQGYSSRYTKKSLRFDLEENPGFCVEKNRNCDAAFKDSSLNNGDGYAQIFRIFLIIYCDNRFKPNKWYQSYIFHIELLETFLFIPNMVPPVFRFNFFCRP